MAFSMKLTPREIALAEDKPVPDDPIDESPSVDDVADDVQDFGSDSGSDDDNEDAPEIDESQYYPDGEGADDTDSEDADADDDADDGEDSWRDDATVKAYAASYGLTEDELGQFESQSELEKFGAMFDRRLARGSSAPGYQQYQQDAPRPQESGLLDRDGSSQPGQGGEPDKDDGPELIDVEKMKEENYDPISIQMAEELNQNRVEKHERQKRESAEREQALYQNFNRVLDDLDPDRFGDSSKATNVTAMQDMSRRTVFDTMLELHQVLQQRGQGDIPFDQLVRRATVVAFGDVAPAGEGKGSSVDREKVQRQSRKRRPTSTGRGKGGSSAPVSASSDDDVETIASSPKLKAFWERTQRQNGVV